MAAFIIAQCVSVALAQEAAESNMAEPFRDFRKLSASSKHRCRAVSVLACRTSLQLSRIRANVEFGGLTQTAASYNKPLVPTRNGEAPLLAAQRRRYAFMNSRMVWLLAFLFLGGCADSEISQEIATQFDSDAATIDLGQLGPEEWERVCVLTPYMDNNGTAKSLGFKWNSELRTSIGGNDGITVLVFVLGQDVVAFTEHSRNKGDLSKLDPHCLSRASATVVRQSGGSGWVYLVTREQA